MTYVIPKRLLEKAAQGEWVGVDWDGTLFFYDDWTAWNVFGEPIPLMFERVHAWLNAKIEVRVITARVDLPLGKGLDGRWDYNEVRDKRCLKTGASYSDAEMVRAIQAHGRKHGLPRLEVQPHKDWRMMEFYDDRAIQVVANTGRTLAEEHEAELAALRGKQFAGERTHASNQPHHPRG